MKQIITIVFLCLLLSAAVAAEEDSVPGVRPQIDYAVEVDGNRSACFSQRAYALDTISPDDMLLLGHVEKTESRQFGRWFYNVVTFEVSKAILGSCQADTVEFLTANTFTLNSKVEAEMRESTALPWVCPGDHILVLLRPNTVREDVQGWTELVYAGFLSGENHSRDQAVYQEVDVRYDAGGYLTARQAVGQASPYEHMTIARQESGILAEDISEFRQGLADRFEKEVGYE